MKCQFCGKSTSKLYSGPNDIALCEECYSAYKERNHIEEENIVDEVIEAKGTVVEEQEATEPVEENPVRCELVIGVCKDGRLYFNVFGAGADLLVVDGLLKYAERRIKQQWDARDAELARAAQAAAQAAASAPGNPAKN